MLEKARYILSPFFIDWSLVTWTWYWGWGFVDHQLVCSTYIACMLLPYGKWKLICSSLRPFHSLSCSSSLSFIIFIMLFPGSLGQIWALLYLMLYEVGENQYLHSQNIFYYKAHHIDQTEQAGEGVLPEKWDIRGCGKGVKHSLLTECLLTSAPAGACEEDWLLAGIPCLHRGRSQPSSWCGMTWQTMLMRQTYVMLFLTMLPTGDSPEMRSQANWLWINSYHWDSCWCHVINWICLSCQTVFWCKSRKTLLNHIRQHLELIESITVNNSSYYNDLQGKHSGSVVLCIGCCTNVM